MCVDKFEEMVQAARRGEIKPFLEYCRDISEEIFIEREYGHLLIIAKKDEQLINRLHTIEGEIIK